MRVIAGHAHGRRLKAPRGLRTRPTSARARESIFSRLQVLIDFDGICVLDVFAGSGSLGCEALSRGAARATFIDSSRAAVSAIESNLRALAMEDRSRIINTDVFRALEALCAENARFDLIFVDAPYRNDLSDDVVRAAADLGVVAPEGWIVVGQSKRAAPPPEPPAGMVREKVVTVGDHRIAFYRRPGESAPSGN